MLKEKKLEDNKMGEVSEGHTRYECGDIAQMIMRKKKKGQKLLKKSKKEKLGGDAVGEGE